MSAELDAKYANGTTNSSPYVSDSTQPPEEDLDSELRRKAVEANFPQLNSNPEKYKDDVVFTQGKVTKVYTEGSGADFSLAVPDGVFFVQNYTTEKVTEGEKIKIYGNFGGKLEASKEPIIAALLIEKNGDISQNTEPISPNITSKTATITKAKFNQIKSGMSYEKVVEIIGGPGELVSETGNPGDPLYTVMYMYKGEGDLGANANFLFQGNKLQNKAQFGLK
ncbi:DUF3862 domain-containing protein [Aneurinibacillus aneurinilyticus]|uniref:DUF3862 domain-containing protein n=2 Tax=Aneurinibacillus aneurinilyticus TaxID=1391 RepID=A0A848CYS7_ANEAE|nr:DUF3862 domain-containing protein [Aneurinibacillus aneurinilyticus]